MRPVHSLMLGVFASSTALAPAQFVLETRFDVTHNISVSGVNWQRVVGEYMTHAWFREAFRAPGSEIFHTPWPQPPTFFPYGVEKNLTPNSPPVNYCNPCYYCPAYPVCPSQNASSPVSLVRIPVPPYLSTPITSGHLAQAGSVFLQRGGVVTAGFTIDPWTPAGTVVALQRIAGRYYENPSAFAYKAYSYGYVNLELFGHIPGGTPGGPNVAITLDFALNSQHQNGGMPIPGQPVPSMRVTDPITFTLVDPLTNATETGTIYSLTADLGPGASCDIDNGLMSVVGSDLTIRAKLGHPYLSVSGELILSVRNGEVVQSVASGVFGACGAAIPIGTTTPFTTSVCDTFSAVLHFAPYAANGVDVQINMDSASGGPGPDLLPMAADHCAASPLLTQPGSVSFDTTLATNDGPGTCGSSHGSPDAWVRFMPSVSGFYTISTCGEADFDTVLSAYSACGGAALACNDDACARQSRIEVYINAGQTIFIRVAGWNSEVGSGQVTISPPLPSDHIWDETADGLGDAGSTPLTAQVIAGNSQLERITGSLNYSGDADVFLIEICDAPNFYVTTFAGAAFDTQLFLFHEDGRGVAFNDDMPTTIRSALSGALVPGNGRYLLAISSFDNDPLDSGGQEMWLDTPYQGERAPDGPGAAGTLTSWSGGGASGPYRISLVGACRVGPGGGCVADVDDGTGSGSPDGGVTIEDLIFYLTIFDSGDIRADVDDGSMSGTPDGGITIDDILYYLFRFDSGC